MKFLLSLLFTFGVSTLVFCQTPIDKSNFNTTLAEQLILDRINHVRDTLHADELGTDNILYQAADLQADYVKKVKKITHYHGKAKYYKLQDRVFAFRGNFEILAENIAYFDILVDVKIPKQHKTVNVKTYEELADELVTGWVLSPGHFRNIKNPKVNSSGISVKFNPSKNRVYAVQVFGKAPINVSAIRVPRDMYGIHPILSSSNSRDCQECSAYFRSLPPEVSFGLTLDTATQQLFFVFTDPNYIEGLFKHKKDGLAIDIIRRSQFACASSTKLNDNPIYKGTLMAPVYLDQIKSTMLVDERENLWIPMGKIPEVLRGEELEFNLLFLKSNTLCRYQEFFDLEYHKWEILEMGLYRDTLSMNDFSENTDLQTITHHKTLRFEIPFEKNKSTYDKEDLKPLYDSLKLTSYNIKKINIQAFASVEGSTKRNHELQEKRASSIVSALQDFQTLKIKTEIVTSENWVEFLNDIASSPYAYMKNFSKERIKEELKKPLVAEKTEIILAKHRKAIITLELEKKDLQSMTNAEEAIKVFNNALAQNDYEKAHDLQLLIFSNLRNEKLPSSLLDKIDIPKSVKSGLLLNHDIAFKYEFEYNDAIETYKLYKDLEVIFPKDAHIKYNLCVLQLKIWISSQTIIDMEQLEKEIKTLSSLGIRKQLVTRLLINFHIIRSEYMMAQREYVKKDQSLKFIKGNYKTLDLPEKDILSLAKYFVSYSHDDWAKPMLLPYARRIDASEDLLFYYLNLTIVDDNITKKSFYRTIMLNANNRNPSRFCKLFETYGKGGITFQLLRNKYLKKTYCENCE